MPLGTHYYEKDDRVDISSIRIVRDSKKESMRLALLSDAKFQFFLDNDIKKVKFHRDIQQGHDIIEFDTDVTKFEIILGQKLTKDLYSKYIKVIMT